MMTIGLVLGARIGGGILALVVVTNQHLGVGVAVGFAEPLYLNSTATPFKAAHIFFGEDQVMRWDVTASLNESAIDTALAWPSLADLRSG